MNMSERRVLEDINLLSRPGQGGWKTRGQAKSILRPEQSRSESQTPPGGCASNVVVWRRWRALVRRYAAGFSLLCDRCQFSIQCYAKVVLLKYRY